MIRAVNNSALVFAVGAALCGAAATAVAQGPDSAIVRGTVYDSVHHAPVSDATIIAAAQRQGLVRTTTTDSHGHFIWALPAGRYNLTVDDPRLDSARIEIAPSSVNAVAGSTNDITLATPSVSTRVRLACGRPQRDTTQGAIIGIVTDANSRRPISGATVALQWSDFSVDRAGKASTMTITRGATTDSTGHFRACGVPIMRTVELQAQAGATNSGIVQEQIDEGGVLIRELRVPLPAGAASPAPALVQGTIKGPTGAPVREGTVLLVGTARTAHVDNGRFALDSVPAGTEQIEVMAIGFYPERVRLDLTPGARQDVNVTMETVAAVMDTITILAHANDPRYREFDKRRMQGYGRFYTAADLAQRSLFQTSDLFTIMPGFVPHVDGHGTRYLTTFGYHPPITITHNDPEMQMAARAGGFGAPSRQIHQNSVCPLLVLNGGPVESLEDIDAVPPSQIYGIEVYGVGDPIPPQYRAYQHTAPGLPPAECGAIIVWTR